MENYRSKSCRDGRMMGIERYSGGGNPNHHQQQQQQKGPTPTSMHDLRSYSTSHASNMGIAAGKVGKKEKMKMKMKMKKTSTSVVKSWSLNDADLQRKKRVATYKVYTVQGKVKGSFKKSFRWIKDTYTHLVYGDSISSISSYKN